MKFVNCNCLALYTCLFSFLIMFHIQMCRLNYATSCHFVLLAYIICSLVVVPCIGLCPISRVLESLASRNESSRIFVTRVGYSENKI